MRSTVPAILRRYYEAKAAEASKNVELRNRIAREIFSNRSRRSITHAGISVVTEWHPQSRSFVTFVNHDSCDYSGNSDDAAVAHLWALKHIADRCSRDWPYEPMPQ